MTSFEGFDLGNVRELRIHSFTVGAGQSAQLTGLVMEVWRENSPEPELFEVDYADDGPPLAAVQAMVRAVNRRQRGRRGEEL